jgi:hypothetical protein
MFPSLLSLSVAYQIPLPDKNYASLRNGTSAYRTLINNGNKQLPIVIQPVTNKTKFAASGDPHDYVSMGPYWWPDPSKPDGLPYIRRDGDRNPEIYDYDRYKLDDFIKSIVALGWAYYYSDNITYANKAAENIRIFLIDPETKMNPNLQFGQMIPGIDNGNGRAEGVIDIYDMVGMMPCVELIVDSGVFSKEEVTALKKWYADLQNWLTSSSIGKEEKYATNNHGIAFDVIVTSFALFGGQTAVATQIAEEFAATRLFTQIEPDGSQPDELARTTALHYSNYNLDHMLDMAERAKPLGIDLYEADKEGRSIPSAVAFLSQFLGIPQGSFPYQQNSSWDTEQTILAWILRRSTQYRRNPAYIALFDEFEKSSASDRKWLIIGGYPEAE